MTTLFHQHLGGVIRVTYCQRSYRRHGPKSYQQVSEHSPWCHHSCSAWTPQSGLGAGPQAALQPHRAWPPPHLGSICTACLCLSRQRGTAGWPPTELPAHPPARCQGIVDFTHWLAENNVGSKQTRERAIDNVTIYTLIKGTKGRNVKVKKGFFLRLVKRLVKR